MQQPFQCNPAVETSNFKCIARIGTPRRKAASLELIISIFKIQTFFMPAAKLILEAHSKN